MNCSNTKHHQIAGLFVTATALLLATACGQSKTLSEATSAGNIGPTGPAGAAGERGESFNQASRRILNKLKSFQAGVVNLQCNGASGSGTRISSDTVVTAFHVIDGATNCVIRSNNLQVAIGTQLSRSPSGRDIGYIRGITFYSDIPIIEQTKDKLPLVGDLLVLMSYPSLFTNDLQTTIGFVTDDNAQNSLGSMGLEWRDSIVSDMSAGGGSSGGPVFNEDGQFVGIHVGGFSGAEGGGTELNFQLIFQSGD
jgi:S1-C subfamily serine protease